jgi:predicted dehydrogenase
VRQVFVDARVGVVVEEVPAPVRQPGQLLVRTHFSAISTGTESSATGAAGGLIKRAIARPDLVKAVAKRAIERGLSETAALVRSRLDRLSPLGYSLSGTVIEADPESDLACGQLVACAGASYAYHAELVTVPRNLVVPVPHGVDLRAGALTTLGAIALQGVRRARAELGEIVAVVGLGLVGQLVAELLTANGCRTFGLDPRPERVEAARARGAIVAGSAPGPAADDLVAGQTDRRGLDAVLIAAAAPGSDPINWAARFCRERGRIVVVGDVGLTLEREPLYRGELDVLVSRSYGPGRYDPTYEEDGIDYPFGHVRWTENRNMAAFLDLVARGRVDLTPLTGQTFTLERAGEAYALATGGEALAVLFDYGVAPEEAATARPDRRLALPRTAAPRAGALRLGIIGPGHFFQNVHLPNLRRRDDVAIRAIASRTGWSARKLAESVGAAYCATDHHELLADAEIDAVLIGTRHDLHAALAADALAAGKHVFVEKPLGLTVEECRHVGDAVETSRRLLTVGFNRRCAPLALRLREWLGGRAGPTIVTFTVEAGPLPRGHWLLDPREGGGRIVGEGCHFLDFLGWLIGAAPGSVIATALGPEPRDELAAQLGFPDGSVAVLTYSGRGDAALGKELVVGSRGGGTFRLDDFADLTVAEGGRATRWRERPDKGHAALLGSFVQAARGTGQLAATVEDGIRATELALAAVESARAGGQPRRIA